MDTHLFDELQGTLTQEGPVAAIDRLCARLREKKDYNSLFYALLMKKRQELGVSPLPTGPSQDLPAHVHEPYEDAIRAAARLVGGLYLQEGNIPQAWAYFRMLGEPEPVARALADYQPGQDEDIQPLVHLAFYENVHPTRGFDWILQRYGICSAITTIGNPELPLSPEARHYCYKRLVRELYQELAERLRADVERRSGTAPTGNSVRELLEGRAWLFEEEFAHVDTSHLGAVVQMAAQLPACPELDMARELCLYGQQLAPRLRYEGDPPFEDQYRDYGVYLAILAGDQVEEGVRHFREKVEKTSPEESTFPAEVLVNLLLRLDRPHEALAVARRYLAAADGRRLTCPGITELCQKANDFRTLAEVAREQNDPVHFVAGLIASPS
jgi:hypothetical protein